MNVGLKDLEFLLAQLDSLRDPINATNWDDALDTWLSLSQLRRRMHGQIVLKQIFVDDKLRSTIGMAYQLQDISRGENAKHVPDGLVKKFKRDAGSQNLIKAHYYGCISGFAK